jgi:hypothetical protein
MTKGYGAFIRCATCGKEPFADDPALECHELRRFNSAGEFSESPAPGEWFCPEHAPPKQRIARTIRGAPLEAVDDFELLLADEGARLMEMLPGDDDANTDDAEAAFHAYRREIEHGLAHLREVIALHKKSPASDTPKPRRSRQRAMTARERNQPGQTSLIEEKPTPSHDTS